MSRRSIALAIVLPILALTSFMLLGSNKVPKNVDIKYQPPAIELTSNQQIKVYYFHGNVRCTTCKRIEQYTTAAVQQGFGRQLGSGQMQLLSVNVETAGNEHYVQDFELITRSVVVEILEDGQPVVWRRLDRVWELVTNEQAFVDYIYREVGRLAPGANHG